MAIHTFGDHADKFHPHLHAIVADGLFALSGTFYVMPRTDLKPLEEIFRARVFKRLKKKDMSNDEIIANLMSWRHSGFSVHNAVRVARDDNEARERVAQYIIRNAFSVANIIYNDKTGTVIYKAKMTHGKDKKNFGIYTPMICPNCGGEMKIISFITERNVIRHILEHLGLWPAKPSRDPPTTYVLPDRGRALSALVSEPYDDGWPGYEEIYAVN